VLQISSAHLQEMILRNRAVLEMGLPLLRSEPVLLAGSKLMPHIQTWRFPASLPDISFVPVSEASQLEGSALQKWAFLQHENPEQKPLLLEAEMPETVHSEKWPLQQHLLLPPKSMAPLEKCLCWLCLP